MTNYTVIRNNAGRYWGGLSRGWVTLRCHARKWAEADRAHAIEFLGYLGMGARLVRVKPKGVAK